VLYPNLLFEVNGWKRSEKCKNNETFEAGRNRCSEAWKLHIFTLTINGQIVANNALVVDLPDAVILAERVASETVDPVKQRIAGECRVPKELLVVLMRGRS
jgi:hypothetical protein